MSLWQSIADTLRAEIARGMWRPGTRLPPEAELAARFGVNRHTLRHATKVLADEGLLYSRRGAGVFVSAAPVEYKLGEKAQFHRNIELAGRVPNRRIDSVVTRSCDTAEAQGLQIAAGAPVHVAEGVASVDHRPVAIFRAVFPADMLPDLPKVLSGEGSITRALAQSGVPEYKRATTRLKATIADEAQAARLQIDPGGPLLRTEAVNIAKGRPVERSIVWWASERVTMVLDNQDS
ncbi:phosphonate metabolism transcriptional regulator PhnF [Paracoccus sp. SCSIO 75233]|uniref:phosphonate metabolism transcriptional regulator PhnF n=1 Tax=Paracoccus sp. SCSIO 75233 TaxID=3017782 RepID=UPI0022F041C2|nr:phosphonate metabolism transcriptional regulator PhnF [Paracoccus sp. SCSIO 75233]WBU51938.1 phosphonate metabolism transcriptional regulator PhnF [Paracoccus sp. SCSIO 75233]